MLLRAWSLELDATYCTGHPGPSSKQPTVQRMRCVRPHAAEHACTECAKTFVIALYVSSACCMAICKANARLVSYVLARETAASKHDLCLSLPVRAIRITRMHATVVHLPCVDALSRNVVLAEFCRHGAAYCYMRNGSLLHSACTYGKLVQRGVRGW